MDNIMILCQKLKVNRLLLFFLLIINIRAKGAGFFFADIFLHQLKPDPEISLIRIFSHHD